MNSTIVEDSSEGSDPELSEETFGKNYGYGIGFSLGILVLLVIIAYASYLCIRTRSRNNSNVPNFNPSSSNGSSMTTVTVDNDQLVFIQQGLNEDILRNYPKLLYSEAKVHKGEFDVSGCSICLADYKDSDLLRILPDCGHIFHVKCIDPWLRLHTTCPICRNSPLPTPLTTPLV
ncbi:RING-H2 finger protein ATL70-like [Nicotiana tabacum]|uniref:RING-type E3 ubiquitin transferase n=1 Tax=Nicotiana tabacum TaxID=4097 RepID=A0A1S4AHE5_TOBAC|nr:PREDICTED: RING-H2 finger protein ATL70-like [Nicotiana tabacum]